MSWPLASREPSLTARPATTLLAERLTPKTLGSLVAARFSNFFGMIFDWSEA